eukprot:jgi/Psemu1/43213/gm1.43213_g
MGAGCGPHSPWQLSLIPLQGLLLSESSMMILPPSLSSPSPSRFISLQLPPCGLWPTGRKGLTAKAVRQCVGKATRDRTSLQKLATGWHFPDPPLALLNPPTHECSEAVCLMKMIMGCVNGLTMVFRLITCEI